MIKVLEIKAGQRNKEQRKMEFTVKVESSIFGLFLKKEKLYNCNCRILNICNGVSQLYCIDSGKWLVEHIGRAEVNKIEYYLEEV